MLRYALNRLLAMVPTALLVLVLVALLLHATPGDPVDALLGEQALPVDRAALRQALGLDLPLWQQLWQYFSGLLQGDWGTSLVNGRPVLALLLERLPATLLLAGSAMGVALILGALAGVMGLFLRGAGRFALEGLTLALLATPSFVLGPLLVAGVAVALNWLPVAGMNSWQSLVLPSLTLGVGLGMVLARFLQASLQDVWASACLLTARAKGASGLRQLGRHALPLAIGPVLQVIFLQLGMVLTGTVLTEAVFGWPGLGTLLVEGLHQRDFPLIQGCLLFISLTYMVCVWLSDVLMLWLDPRIRQGLSAQLVRGDL